MESNSFLFCEGIEPFLSVLLLLELLYWLPQFTLSVVSLDASEKIRRGEKVSRL